MTYYEENGAWEIVDTSVITTKHVIEISFRIKRRPDVFLVNILLPIGALETLNLLVFLLPVESGERVGYSITLMLALSVFLTLTVERLPKTSYPKLPLLDVKLVLDMLISCFVILFTIVGLKLYHKKGNTVPKCLQYLAYCLLFRCCKRTGEVRNRCKDSDVCETYTTAPEAVQTDTCDIDRETSTVNEVSWADVARASDVLFFLLSLVAFAISHLVFVAKIIYPE